MLRVIFLFIYFGGMVRLELASSLRLSGLWDDVGRSQSSQENPPIKCDSVLSAQKLTLHLKRMKSEASNLSVSLAQDVPGA